MQLTPNSAPSAASETFLRPAKAALHVLTLTPFFPSLENEVGGCFVKEPLDSLAQLGVTSSVIAATPIHQGSRHASPAVDAKWVRYPQVPGTLGLSSAGQFLYARLSREVSRLHRERPVDVIHAHAALPCGHAALLIARQLGIPYVVTVHGLDVFNACFGAGSPAEWRRRASITAYRGASNVICVSRKVQQILRESMGGNLRNDVLSTVVYNGTDPELFSPDPASGGQSSSQAPRDPQSEILIVGNLIPSKGQELVLRAIHRIAGSFPQLCCQIIGEGPDRARLEALARKLGILPRVNFRGRQSRRAVADAMRCCSLFVLPSRSEGLGCVYLEAMACAKPVIACRGQGIEEIVEHEKNGWLITPDHLDELVQGLFTLLQSREVALRIGLAARQRVLDGLTLSHQAQQLAAIYRDANLRTAAA